MEKLETTTSAAATEIKPASLPPPLQSGKSLFRSHRVIYDLELLSRKSLSYLDAAPRSPEPSDAVVLLESRALCAGEVHSGVI